MGLKVHHTGILASNVQQSVRFYRDGLGLDLLSDVPDVEGDWPRVFGTGSRRARTISLGDRSDPSAGVVELIVFEGAPLPPVAGPMRGMLLVSFVGVDVDAMLARLAAQGIEPVGRIRGKTSVAAFDVATVRDPDGVLVELVGEPGTP